MMNAYELIREMNESIGALASLAETEAESLGDLASDTDGSGYSDYADAAENAWNAVESARKLSSLATAWLARNTTEKHSTNEES
jgi:hypothetical protein